MFIRDVKYITVSPSPKSTPVAPKNITNNEYEIENIDEIVSKLGLQKHE